VSDNGVYRPAALSEAFPPEGYSAHRAPGEPVPEQSQDESICADRAETPVSRRLVATGNFFFKYRNVGLPLVFCSLAFGTKPTVPGGSRRLDLTLDAVGIAIGLAGQLLRILVIGFAYIKRGGRKKHVYAETLVQEGFFAHCRNPLYLGNILTVVGLAMIHNGVWLYLVGIPFFLLVYASITAAEEDYLQKKFGRLYEDYCERVPRFAISFKGLGKTLKGMKYDWRKTIRKEYGSTFTFLTLVLALLGWEAIAFDGFQSARGRLVLLTLVWIPTVMAYCSARIAKKAGVLGKD